MRTGICPKCGSHTVYSSGGSSRQMSCLGVQRRAFLPEQHLTSYVCAVCGYTESYIADPNALREIVQTWDRVYSTPYR